MREGVEFHAGFHQVSMRARFPCPSSRLPPLRLFSVCCRLFRFRLAPVASIVRAIFTVQRRRAATRWSAKFLDKLRQLSSKRGRPRPRSRPQLKRDIKSSFASSVVKNITRKLRVYEVLKGDILIEFLFIYLFFFYRFAEFARRIIES